MLRVELRRPIRLPLCLPGCAAVVKIRVVDMAGMSTKFKLLHLALTLTLEYKEQHDSRLVTYLVLSNKLVVAIYCLTNY